MNNVRIAEIFEELAERLELMGESPFKARAYRTFAEEVTRLDEPVSDIAARGDLRSIPGAGKAIAQKVDELLARGTFPAIERARAEVPSGLLDLLKLPGLGPKTARALWHDAELTSIAELAVACEEDRIANLPGFGEKRQEKMLEATISLLGGKREMLLAVALDAARLVASTLVDAGATRAAVVGEARRGEELTREAEVLAQGITPEAVLSALRAGDDELMVRDARVSEGEVAIMLQGRGPARIRIVKDPADWVHGLLVHTGDEAHVRWLSDLASARGGLAAVARGTTSEREVYERLGVAYVPPELRGGLIKAPPERLLTQGDLRGVFHVHTDWSDGTSSIVDMAEAAAERGLTYVGISDHSQAADYANGLTPERLAEQARAIERARQKVPQIHIFHGVEVDILPDGALDLDDATLAPLDFVIASVHAHLSMTSEEMTARLLRAVSHPRVTMLGHPTGRLLRGRKGFTFDVAKVAAAAAKNGTFLEINANAHRLDLSPPLLRQALTAGASFVINPDAHAIAGFDDTPLGITVARRARLSAEQVFNTRPLEDVRAHLRRGAAQA